MMTQSLNESPDDSVSENWLDDGPEKGRRTVDPKIVERMCLATRERLPVSQMIRFVRAPDGAVVPDLAGKLPGRGVWVKADRAALTSLVTPKSGFARGFRAPSQAGPELVVQLDDQLLKKCQASLGLAKRAGDLILGYDQVRNELQKRKPGWLLEAADGAEDGRRRVVGLAVALYERVRIASALTSSELGMALGREHVVHGLLKTGRFADVWTRDYRRLYAFRQMTGDIWVSGTVG